MKFRRLYWVTEQVAESGESCVIGVFTSIHDLRVKGVKWCDGCAHKGSFRVTLVKLDSPEMPLGKWEGPDFAGIEGDLHTFVETGEFDEPSIIQLASDLRAFSA
ncbi:MAG: hypothetical protein JNM28_08975 [Armatimonadetes bacterium]|nr:hypothetical protein [Armatimonadota bacterium]MBS1710806.1 hypothetical protein [Armatimonadota bacterium]MBX3108478.1 hypothetical protein [Fimbriimonadaceae bacterium]